MRTSQHSETCLPAANILLAFPPFTSIAVTGPGSSSLVPIADQVLLAKLNCNTLVKGASADSASEPEVTRSSSSRYRAGEVRMSTGNNRMAIHQHRQQKQLRLGSRFQVHSIVLIQFPKHKWTGTGGYRL